LANSVTGGTGKLGNFNIAKNSQPRAYFSGEGVPRAGPLTDVRGKKTSAGVEWTAFHANHTTRGARLAEGREDFSEGLDQRRWEAHEEMFQAHTAQPTWVGPSNKASLGKAGGVSTYSVCS